MSVNDSCYVNTSLTDNVFQWTITSMFISLSSVVIVVLTIGGNLLVLFAVLLSPHLRSPTHYLIVNLAVADLLLGTLVLPFSATLEVSGQWYFGSIFCDVWAAVDVLCCTASILSLCVISVDRYIGVTRPLNYSAIMTEKRVTILCLTVWVASFAISIGPLVGWREAQANPMSCTVTTQPGYVVFSSTGSFYLPTLIILLVYWRIYRAALKQTRFLESGVKTSKTEITLRVHTGASNTTASLLLPSKSTADLANASRPENNTSPRRYSESGEERNVASLKSSTMYLEVAGIADKPLLNPPNAAVRLLSNPAISSNLNAPGRSSSFYKQHSFRGVPSHNSAGLSTRGRVTQSSTNSAGSTTRLFKFRRQKKAAKTLGIVVGVYLLCWFPFFIILPVGAFCQVCDIPQPLFSFFFWLGYCNSCLNPFIYASTSRDFQRAFQRILCQSKYRRSQRATLMLHPLGHWARTAAVAAAAATARSSSSRSD